MRVLWIGDAGCHSGFATVTHEIGERLVRDFGHEVHVLASNYLGDYWPTNLRLYIASRNPPTDIYGERRFIEMLGKVTPEAVIFNNDPQVILNMLVRNPFDPMHVMWNGYPLSDGAVYRPPLLTYMPIDGYDSPRSWDILAARVKRIAMSHFGQQTMTEAPVVWHGVDTSVFRPRDKKEAKRELGFDPDRFLILRVDKNSFRKDYPASWLALRPLLRKYADIDVHFHCDPQPTGGNDLNALRYNDEDIRDRVSFSTELGGYVGWPTERLATLQAAADLFISTSWGEGFGLTILQSMACGTPVIAQDCSSITEIVADTGILIQPAGRVAAPMGQYQCRPDIDAFTAAIEHLYAAGGTRRKLGAAAAERATMFSWDIATAKIDEILRTEVADAVPKQPEPATSDPV